MSQQEPSLYFQPQADTPLEPLLVAVLANNDGVPLSKEWIKTLLDKLDGCDVYDRNLFLSGLHPGCRLYDDEKGAFFSGLKPNLDLSPLTAFERLGVASISNTGLAIAVWCRAPTLVTNTPPNLRIAVKDYFLVHGIKKSLCNRAYYDLSEPAAFTAEVIQALINDGAHILGLTKLSSVIAREEPVDAVDYSTALNPRGNGYQSPAGSSSGSAAAVAAYGWLDCAIGTDTSGSGRRPALANGVWQFRPSHDSISLRGLVKTYDIFDTSCVFARSLDALRRVADTWIAVPSLVKKQPYRLDGSKT
ncbi:Amidase signature domain [Fusarium oxysporum f. sp. vasinfectum]|nr:Amidase signature domain [Fusarium oxysporum f. sp. vasinfectum]